MPKVGFEPTRSGGLSSVRLPRFATSARLSKARHRNRTGLNCFAGSCLRHSTRRAIVTAMHRAGLELATSGFVDLRSFHLSYRCKNADDRIRICTLQVLSLARLPIAPRRHTYPTQRARDSNPDETLLGSFRNYCLTNSASPLLLVRYSFLLLLVVYNLYLA